jgi:hypothetical protein
MIIDEQVNIKIGPSNMKHYKSKGYLDIKCGDYILVNVNDLLEGTGIKVNVKCDICGAENYIYFQKYNLNFKRYGYYSCIKCGNIKRKQSVQNKYGVDNISKNFLIKEKKKKTCIKNYGVENPSQSLIIHKRKQETMQENYGVNYAFESKYLYDKMKEIKLNKYNNEYYTNIEKAKNTVLFKYGVSNISQLDFVKKLKANTCYNNYGVEHPSQNKDIFEKQQKISYKILKYENNNIYYQGSYELDFLKNFYRIYPDIQRGCSIEYIFNNENKIYHPDFYIKDLNLIIEIKSFYTYNKELIKNLSKEQACIDKNYKFIFIIDKCYDDFNEIIKNNI